MSPSRSHTQLKLFAFVAEGTRTGFAMANPSETTESSITVRTSDSAGTVLGDVRVTLPPLQHTAVFLDEAPYLMQTDGSVTLTASEPVIALTLRLDDGTKLAGVPVVTPTQQGDGELAPDSVITETLVDGAVTGSKIADGAVGSRQLADRVDFGAEGSAGSVVIGNNAGRGVVVLDTLEDGGGAIVLGDADGNVTTLLSGGGTGVGNALLSIVDPITQIPLIDIQANKPRRWNSSDEKRCGCQHYRIELHSRREAVSSLCTIPLASKRPELTVQRVSSLGWPSLFLFPTPPTQSE